MDVLKYSAKELRQKLATLISDEGTLDTLENEGVNGKSFLDLTREDLLFMKIKMGPTKELLKIIDEFKENVPSNIKVPVGIFTINSSGVLEKDNEANVSNIEDATESEPEYIFNLDDVDSMDEVLSVPNITSKNISVAEESDEESAVCSKKRKINVDENATSLQDRNEISTGTTTKINKFQFSRYDTVEQTLLSHKQGKEVIRAIKTTFTEQDRRCLVRIVVAELISVYNSCYPPTEAKTALARAIVTEFPPLKSTITQLGYEHYFDPQTKQGFIEYRLMTCRTKLPPEERKNKQRVSDSKDVSTLSFKSNLLSTDELKEKVTLMKFKFPALSNKRSITTYLKETFFNRRNWILESSPSISEVFKQYPRLLDYDGDMIDEEFSLMFPEKVDNFIKKFSTFYVPRILIYTKKYKPELLDKFDTNDENLKAILILIALLPSGNTTKRKNSTTGSISENIKLIEILPENTDLQNFASEKRRQSKNNVQPYIICLQGNSVSYFIQADEWTLHRTDKSTIVTTFDLLFKLYFCLNLVYPATLSTFFNFIDFCIYKVSAKAGNSVTSLHINLSNVDLSNKD